jgi:Uma2 family endonuclease
VIEVEISSPRLEKLELYARLGVPEIWRFDGATLSILILGPDQRYHGSENSLSFPFLRIDALTGWIDETQHLGEMDRRRAFRAWVHERLEPLFRERS